jgi:hypothetical protein
MSTDVYLFISYLTSEDAILKFGGVDRFLPPTDSCWAFLIGAEGFTVKNPYFYVLANSVQQ